MTAAGVQPADCLAIIAVFIVAVHSLSCLSVRARHPGRQWRELGESPGGNLTANGTR